MLERPFAARLVLLISLTFMLPSLNTGLAADDYVHQLMLDAKPRLSGFVRAPLDIFRFTGERYSPLLRDDGVFTWWDDMHAKLAFFRPVSALTHWLDHAWFADLPWLMHLHSLLWGAVLMLGVLALYREILPSRFSCTLAFALYALDDARAWFVSWVAARNATVATAFSVWAIYLHVRHRKGTLAAGVWLAPLSLALGLCSGEGAIATYGYLFGYALFVEKDPLMVRMVRLWPYAFLLIGWRVLYRYLDYGVFGSSLYADPINDPLAYLMHVLERAPVLVATQVGGPWSDTWTSLFVFPALRVVFYSVFLCGSALVVWFAWPYVRREPVLRFCLVGSALSVLPACAVFPADRLLTWIAIGACPVLAAVIEPLLCGRAMAIPHPRLSHVAPALGFLLVFSNLVLAPLLIPSRARGNIAMRDILGRADAGVPRDESIRDKTVMFVNPPAVPLASYIPITRAALDEPRPRAQRLLATATTELTVTRTGERTLRLAPRGGFLQNPASKLLWSPSSRPFHAGEHIAFGDDDVKIEAITPDARPLRVEITFAHPLEDPSYLWLSWQDVTYVPFFRPRRASRSCCRARTTCRSCWA